MSKNYDFRNLRVLVVDDCKFMRGILERMLDALGIGYVRVAIDGISAWDLLQTEDFDLVITDWEMDGVSGQTAGGPIASCTDREYH